MIPKLAQWLDWIVEEHHKHRPLGLDRVEYLVDQLQLMNPAPKTVVVAGTNGKGSTVRYLEHIMQDLGYTVGTTTSPHLNHYNERIRVANSPISDEDILSAFDAIEKARDGIPLTFFEWATLAGLVIFKRHEVDRAILEVGLGGRLDACNVVDRQINVITNIGMDHTHILGSDREAIGSEKAGILKREIPVVYGDETPVSSVMERSRELNCPMYRVNQDFGHNDTSDETWSSWAKARQGTTTFSFATKPSMPDSAALAVQTVLVLENTHKSQLESIPLQVVDLPGRMEFQHFRDRDWLLDVAHNSDAAKFIKKHIEVNYPNREISVLLGCLEDKDVCGVADGFGVESERMVVTSTKGHRGLDSEELRKKLYPRQVRVEPDVRIALDYLVGTTSPHDLILVAGSFELVGRVRKMITIGIGRRG